MFILVCFDISENKIRYRCTRALRGLGKRVQKSVFECSGITEAQFLRLKERLELLIDRRTDTVRYYFLCGHCIGNVEWSGTGGKPVEEKVEIV